MHSCNGLIHNGRIIANENILMYDGHYAVITILESDEEIGEDIAFKQLYDALKNWHDLKHALIQRLDKLLLDLQTWTTMHNKEQVRGNCNEIEITLLQHFCMKQEQLDLIEEKAVRFAKYIQKKHETEAAREFQEWLKETGITMLDWMLDADIIYPAIIEAENYCLGG